MTRCDDVTLVHRDVFVPDVAAVVDFDEVDDCFVLTFLRGFTMVYVASSFWYITYHLVVFKLTFVVA